MIMGALTSAEFEYSQEVILLCPIMAELEASIVPLVKLRRRNGCLRSELDL